MQSTHANHPSLKLIAAFDRGDWPSVLEQVAPNARAYIGGNTVDRDGWKQFGQMWSAAFPDTKHEIVASHVAGETATVVCTLRATHKGDFMGMPATGRQITMEVIHVDRVVDGRIVEHRGQFDSAGLMQQLAGAPVDHRPFITSLFALIDSKQFDAAREQIAPNGRFIMGGQPALDRDGWAAFSKGWYEAFSDGVHHNDQIISAGDRAICVGRFTGTHRGAFQGIPATGRKVSFTYLALATLVGNKVLEMRVEGDFAGLFQQLTA
jgi:predicted ester cyclase